MTPSRLGAAGAAIVVLALAGCGGGKDSTHKAFADSLNTICKQENVKLAKVKAPSTTAGIPAYVGAAVPIIQDEIAQLQKVSTPADQKTNLTGATTYLTQQVTAAQQMSAAAASGDSAKVKSIIHQNSLLHGNAQKLAKKMGASDCAK
ncbi:MAG: hypothetical protein JWN32_553 [Solirubrobacterales bacterium]|nr:hypothetical protein [Solirubrobacterales bacterium]